jgi:hypothetical protein
MTVIPEGSTALLAGLGALALPPSPPLSPPDVEKNPSNLPQAFPQNSAAVFPSEGRRLCISKNKFLE